MQYTTLGRTGVVVSRLCLGAMMFGSDGNADHDDCLRIMHRAFDGGVNFIDTADVYAYGESEEIAATVKGAVTLAVDSRRPVAVLMSKDVLGMRR